MAISNRLKTIAELVTPGYRAADIGTDHGYVPIYLIRNGIASYVIAADLSPESLNKARENARRAGLLLEHSQEELQSANPSGDLRQSFMQKECSIQGIECRLSDGLSEIRPGEVDSIIISGMGGILMDRILRTHMEVTSSAKELILSPHRDIRLLKDFAMEYGYEITADLELMDKKKCYHILKIKLK